MCPADTCKSCYGAATFDGAAIRRGEAETRVRGNEAERWFGSREFPRPPRGAGRSGRACIYFTCLTYVCIVLYIQDSTV